MRDHGKSFTKFPGFCSLDGCIDRKQVALFRDIRHRSDNLSNRLALFGQLDDVHPNHVHLTLDLVHTVQNLLDRFLAFTGYADCLQRFL